MVRSGLAALLLLAPIVRSSAAQPANNLNIYIVDVEGGNAVLVVSPSGESLLIDTGNLNAAVRDAQRIMAAVKDAALRQIDHLVTTHWHLDHFGGMAELARQIPIREFIDHGASVQPNAQTERFLQHTYPRLYTSVKHTVVKAGDTIPMKDVEIRVVASSGQTIDMPLPGAGNGNPYCAGFIPEDEDRTENAQSVGLHITFGRFRALHLGDLSADREFDLMCPDNRIGTVDLFMVSHHGQLHSNSRVLVHAIESRAAIMNNGLRKGGEPEVMKVIHSASGLEDLWQLHFSELSGQEYTVPGIFIANLTDKQQPFVRVAPIPPAKAKGATASGPVHNGTAYWIKVSAQPNGAFTITNARNGFFKTYRAKEGILAGR
jgi:beta-lactamase superfamily II metal-dependent hydrolase